jgi:hypothetical protein
MINQSADESDGVLPISLDTRATVKIGPFSRGGYNRQSQHAYDHDFQTSASLTPFGLLLPKSGHNHLWFTESRVTADFMADRLNEMIPVWKTRDNIHKLVINADNGPECSGRRTQWLNRLVALADDHQIEIQSRRKAMGSIRKSLARRNHRLVPKSPRFSPKYELSKN